MMQPPLDWSADWGIFATENLIRHELISEFPNRVIIPPHGGDDRTAVALAGVAREVATPARS
jgi:hypothetical protein